MAKKPKCPKCKEKLRKLRNKNQMYCTICGYVQGDIELFETKEKITEQKKTLPEKEQIKEIPTPATRTLSEKDHIAIIKAKRPPGDYVSRGLLSLAKVTIFCWSRGNIRGFAYGTRCPYSSPIWKKVVTGREAYTFLLKIKRSNRNKKLESKQIIPFN